MHKFRIMMKAVLKFIVRLCVIVVIGSIVALWAFSFHPRCKTLVDKHITSLFEKKYKAHFFGNINSISLFNTSISYKDVLVVPLENNNQWNWKAQDFVLEFSLLKFIESKKIGLSIVLSGCNAFSEYIDDNLSIFEHINLLFSASADSPFVINSFVFLKSALEIKDKKRDVNISCCWQSDTKQSHQGLITEIKLYDGQCVYCKENVFTQLQGTIATKNQSQKTNFTLEAFISGLPQDKNKFYLKGSWDGKNGSCSLCNENQLVSIAPITLHKKEHSQDYEWNIKGTFPLSYALNIFKIGETENQGTCSFKVGGSFLNKFKGTVFLQKDEYSASGNICIDFIKNKITGNFYNDTDWKVFTGWTVPEQAFKILLNSDFKGQGAIEYTSELINKKTEQKFISSGNVDFFKTNLQWKSSFENAGKKYFFTGSTDPFSCKVIQQGAQEKNLVSINGTNTEISGTLETSLLQELLYEWLQIKVAWSGKLAFTGKWHDFLAQGTLSFNEGFARISPLYNVIKRADAQFVFDFLKYTLTLKNVSFGLQKGTIKSESIKFGYDYVQQKTWAHIPLVFDDCFINWGNGLYADISGALVLKKAFQGLPKLNGFIIFDRACLKENIFSQETKEMLTQSLSSSSLESQYVFDLTCASRSPVSIITPELETKAQFMIHSLKESSHQDQPSLKGTIIISGGTIHFPAYELPLVKGSLVLSGQDIAEPLIELVAQGRIKKYVITLSCSGTAVDPHIVFDATPSLSQEQIMMLLFTGSEEDSLNQAIPSLIMRNVENFIFGNTTGARIKKWLEPLRRIKFIPRFTDQTGRGGFKGALEIEVSKRLRAMIEKNFSLTEDVAFEVEYALTDGMSIRATRDERGDLGACIEMRFKF